MKKTTLNLIELFFGSILTVLYLFTGNSTFFALGLLISLFFIIDSFMYMVQKKFLNKGLEPIGGDYAGQNNSFNK